MLPPADKTIGIPEDPAVYSQSPRPRIAGEGLDEPVRRAGRVAAFAVEMGWDVGEQGLDLAPNRGGESGYAI